METSSIRIARSDCGYVVQVIGKGVMHPSHAMQAFAESIEDNEKCELTIDLSQCEKVDSTFLGCLVALQKMFGGKRSGRFSIAAPKEVVDRLLGPLKMVALFTIVESAPDAVGESYALPVEEATGADFGRHVMKCHEELAQIEGPNQEIFAKITEQLANELNLDPPE